MTFTPPTYAWKMRYWDKRTFSSFDGEPWESPELGLIIVTQPGPAPDFLIDSTHYLYREDLGRWMVVDDTGLLDQLRLFARFITAYRSGLMLPLRDEFTARRREAQIELRGK